MHIRNETPRDYAAVENVTREAFWNVYRPGCLEHYIVHVLRTDPAFVPELDLVLEDGGQLIGHILYMRAGIVCDNAQTLPVMTFGPVSIHPAYQRRGLGTLLIEESMRRARRLGAGALCIEGNPGFYGRLGFVPASVHGVRWHGAPPDEVVPYFLIRELEPGFLHGIAGVYHTPAGYDVSQADAERFDQNFPPKQKRVLPGQLF